jgi:hypothetical protein
VADHPLRPATDRSLGRPLPHQLANRTRAPLRAARKPFPLRAYAVLAAVSSGCSPLQGRFPRVPHPSATDPEGSVRLACVRPAASVRSEPGSNSHVELTSRDIPSLTAKNTTQSIPGPKNAHVNQMPLKQETPSQPLVENVHASRSHATKTAQNRRPHIPPNKPTMSKSMFRQRAACS